jgi:glycosyltransferase involved in cell wall biosynthesis
MRFHLLGVPHTISTPEYSACAFTAKVVNMAKMLARRGHEVIHYGHEESQVAGGNVAITGAADLFDAFGDWDWREKGFPPYQVDSPLYRKFTQHAIDEIRKRVQPGDFLLCPFGAGHRGAAAAFPDIAVVEPGIGYASGHFAPYKAFESYSILHAYLGTERITSMSNSMWYDVVIPNYFDTSQFDYVEKKDSYLLHIGRLGAGKGTHIALQAAKATGHKLLLAGQIDDNVRRMIAEMCPTAEYLGVVNPKLRAKLMSEARAVLCPSMYVEPFCGVQVEAFLSGTPVVSTDWGAFTEYNVHRVTGFRCRTFEQFKLAIGKIGDIRPKDCRTQGMRFSLDAIYPQFHEFFSNIQAVQTGKGFYEDRGLRDWYLPH